jgi:hypothetical protein
MATSIPPYEVDRLMMADTLRRYTGVAITGDPASPDNILTSPILLAVEAIIGPGFSAAFIPATDDIISRLHDPNHPTDPNRSPLTQPQVSMLIAFRHFWHRKSALNGGPAQFAQLTVDEFRNWIVSDYEPGTPLKPWGKQVEAMKKEKDQALATWKKQLKIAKTDYPVLKDDVNSIRFQEEFLTTLKTHGLAHLIDPSYVPANTDLHDAETKWMYQVFVHAFKSPTTKTIVKEHEKAPIIHHIWHLITEHCSHSTVIRSKTTALLTYIASAQLSDGTWRGTIENFLANFFEQVRQHNEISPSPFSTTQVMDFVDNSCKGYETLTAVRKQAGQTKALAGGRDITIEEYKTQLIAQAQELDLKTRPARNPRPRRNANVHELLFDDDETPVEYESNVHEYDEFDADTDVSVLLAHKSEQRNSGSRPQPNQNQQPRRA